MYIPLSGLRVIPKPTGIGKAKGGEGFMGSEPGAGFERVVVLIC